MTSVETLAGYVFLTFYEDLRAGLVTFLADFPFEDALASEFATPFRSFVFLCWFSPDTSSFDIGFIG